MEILTLFGNRLVPRVNQPVANLSYANRRRVEIARALASRPSPADAGRADRRHEPGGDDGAGRAD